MANDLTTIDDSGIVEVRNTQTEMMIGRQAQEVQAAIVIAKRFPRNTTESFNRVMEACKRKGLAENAIYEYPRGGQKVTGPSIRLAEAIAQNWGNIDFGITELEQRDGESQVMAYAWDLETNTRQTKIFTVKHIRSTRQGNYALTDPRDIYELVANNGARRLRACILGVIPGDVVDSAVAACNRTLMDDSGKEPLEDQVRKLASIYKEKMGITVKQLEKYIGCSSSAFTMQDIIKLKRVYNSIKDEMMKKEDVFETGVDVVDAFADEKPKQAPKKDEPKPAPKAEPTKQEEQQSFEIPDDFNEPDELPFK